MTRSRWLAAVVFVTLTGLAVRLVLLNQSLFADELFTFEIATRDSLSAVISGVSSELEVSPPLYNILAWCAHWLGDPMVSIRIPSLIAGTALIPAVYALGAAVKSRAAGLLAATLVALNPFVLYDSIEARPFALMMLLLALSTLALLRASEGEKAYRWWALYVVLTTLALYTHYTVVFVIAAQGFWVLLCYRQRLPALALSWLASAVLFTPWLPELFNDRSAIGSAIIALLHPLTGSSFLTDVAVWLIGIPNLLPRQVPGPLALALDLLALVVMLVGAGLTLRGRRPARPSKQITLVALTALAAPTGLLAYSALWSNIFEPRNLVSSTPAVAVWVAAGVVLLPRRLAIAAATLLTAGFVVGAVATLAPEHRRPDFKGIAALVDSGSRNDVLLDYSGLVSVGPPSQQLRVALENPHPYVSFGDGQAASPLVKAAELARAGSGRIFLVKWDYLGINTALPIPGFHVVSQQAFNGIQHFIVFTYAADKPRGN